MNKVVLIGRLTKEPELTFTPGNGTAVAKCTIAVNRRFSKDGQKEADFIPIVIWGKQAESTANYMTKGKLIGIAGRIETRSYDAKDGTGKRYVTEVIAEEAQFLEWGEKPAENGSKTSNEYGDGIIPTDENEGEIPF